MVADKIGGYELEKKDLINSTSKHYAHGAVGIVVVEY